MNMLLLGSRGNSVDLKIGTNIIDKIIGGVGRCRTLREEISNPSKAYQQS